MRRSVYGVGLAVLMTAGVQPVGAQELNGFNVNYEALLVVEDDAGSITSATGTGLSLMITDCINWVYNDSINLLLEGDGTNFQIVSDLSYSESIEGTHGSISQSLSIVSSSADFPGGEISYSAQYERESALGDGVAVILLEAGDNSIDGALPINTGEHLPIQAYKELLTQLKDGADRIEIPISALGSLESMEPRAGEGLMAVYEVVDSPFEDLDLPETYDDIFAGDSWAVRAELPPVEDSSDPEEVIFEIYESGAISFWLITFEGAQIALKPTFAAINPGAC